MGAETLICIVGPTAVGKSTVAQEVACALGGEVVSVDSMQVYRGMDIGTAKMMPEERKCPLHMVDVAEVGLPYSVACFQHDARACVDELLRKGRCVVLCGGTGLYLDAVVDEMSFPHGETGGETRSRYEEHAERFGPECLYALLKERDPRSAEEIHPHNVRRVVRALEMLDQGVSYAGHHEGLLKRAPHYRIRMWALYMPREDLYAVIDKRVDQMFDSGLEDEVKRLSAMGLREAKTAGKAIGYKEVLQALEGSISMDEARELVKRNTRRYAKRQLSWLRRDGRARWLNMKEMSAEDAVREICEDWRSTRS